MEEQDQVFVERSAKDERSLGSRILSVSLRLLLVILLGGAIGVGIYYGIPALYRDFIQPIQTNTQRISALEETLARTQVDIRERHSTLSTSVIEVEGDVAKQREGLAELQAQGDGLGSRIEDLDSGLEEMQSLSDHLQKLEENLNELDSRLGSLEKAFEEDDPPIEHLQYQIQLLRVMELVTRSRYWMIQDNNGKASEDLLAAKGILEALDEKFQEEELLDSIIERLDQVLFEIPLSPIIAADDLEIVWQLLLLATEP